MDMLMTSGIIFGIFAIVTWAYENGRNVRRTNKNFIPCVKGDAGVIH